MKILHVIANLAPRYGGPSKACWEMARAMAVLGHQVSIYTTNQDGDGVLPVEVSRSQWRDGVEIRYFPIQPPRFWGTSLPLARALRRRIPDVDLVHVHSLYLFHDLVVGYYCRRYGVPYLIQPHGSLDPFIQQRHRRRKQLLEWAFQNRALKNAAGIVFTTAEERELAAPYTLGTPGLVVPLGIDFAEFAALPEPGRFRSRYPEIGSKTIILFLGRINFKKGLDLLAQGFGAVARARDDVHLVIAGPDDDNLGGQVRAWLEAAGVLERTTFTGMVLGPDKVAAYRDAAMFVLPSYSENFGLAVVEAMAAELPVIISDKVNIWREVAAGAAGGVIACDPQLLAAEILKLLNHPEEARQMGRRGRELVQARFTWPQVGGQLEEAYGRIVAEHQAQKTAGTRVRSAAEARP